MTSCGTAQLDLYDQMRYQSKTTLEHAQSVCAVQMSLFSIAGKYNGPLEAAPAFIDDDRYDMVE